MRWIAPLVLLVSLGFGVPAGADQNDRRLDDLFTELKTTGSARAAARAERIIWMLWFQPAREHGHEVARMMRSAASAAQLGQLEQAERIYGEIVAVAPTFAEAWNRRATIRFALGDYAGSIADIGEVLSLEPRHFGALSGLGLCYAALEDYPRAIAAFEAALALNPHMAAARANIEDLRLRMLGEPI